jgi:hypothetical protein
LPKILFVLLQDTLLHIRAIVQVAYAGALVTEQFVRN